MTKWILGWNYGQSADELLAIKPVSKSCRYAETREWMKHAFGLARPIRQNPYGI